MVRKIAGPFNRVEGDLEVSLDIENATIVRAEVNSPLYRGFEQILEARPAYDALVIAPRICGICSVAQSVAAASAIRDAMGITIAPSGQYMTQIALAGENISDHLTHFFLFFMPDFARPVYQGAPWYQAAVEKFQALKGRSARGFLEARSKWVHILGILAGKWPHSIAFQPGGMTKAIGHSERIRLLATLHDFRRYFESSVLGDTCDGFLSISTEAELLNWANSHQGDFPFFLTTSNVLHLETLGSLRVRLMSYGAYPIDQGKLFKSGTFFEKSAPLDLNAIEEDLTSSWMDGPSLPPAKGRSVPDIEKTSAYSWCKSPRLSGEAIEVGAFARQVIDGNPLCRSLYLSEGSNVRNRVIGRFVEVARLLIAMEAWIKAIDLDAPYCTKEQAIGSATGVGLVEAARGSLGHWMSVKDGRIDRYQIIAPTTWNFSPRDAHGIAGPLEQALQGLHVDDTFEKDVRIQHVVRSFDPCMVCTVH